MASSRSLEFAIVADKQVHKQTNSDREIPMKFWDLTRQMLIAYRETFRWDSEETFTAVAAGMLFVYSVKIVVGSRLMVGGILQGRRR